MTAHAVIHVISVVHQLFLLKLVLKNYMEIVEGSSEKLIGVHAFEYVWLIIYQSSVKMF